MEKHFIIREIDNPTKFLSKLYSYLIFILIYLSVINASVEAVYPEVFSSFKTIFVFIEYFILFVFSMEIIIRLIYDENRFTYFKSFYGFVDLLSVIPALVSYLVGGLDSAIWIRIFKIFRILRILKIIKLFSFLDGITGKVIPFIAFAIALKGVMVMFETYSWWPKIENVNTFIAVIGFALAVLMGTKLSVVNGRIYQIEDALCRIVGSLRDMQSNKNLDQGKLLSWSLLLEETLKYNKEDKYSKVQTMREKTNELESYLEERSVGGPNTAGFHRDIAYLLHRVIAKTPIAYEKFLKHVIITYIVIIIFILPGVSGLIMTTLIVYVLGGMYFLIDDMDSPLDYDDESFIDVRLDVLEDYNVALRSNSNW